MAFVTPDSAEGVRVRLSACLRLVRQYEWLIDCYVLDFFVEDHWSRIPSEWRDTLASLSWEQIQSWLNPASHTVKSQSPFPLSLLALKSSVKALSLTRSPVPNLDPIREFFSVSPNGSTWPPPAFGSDMSRSVYNIFRKHIKEKKQHEIVRMVQLTDLLAAKSGGCHQVVDIGSGVGHLSRLLSYDRGFRVTCVDTEKDFSASAKNIDADLNREMVHRVDPAHSRAAPTHLTYRIEPNTSAEDFQVSLGPHLEASPQYGLLGLHTCGDLGPCLIRLFVESKDAVFLQSVGEFRTEVSPGMEWIHDFALITSYFFSRLLLHET